MRIKPSFFNNGLEVDCLGRYEGHKRMSIRRPSPDRHEVYTFDYITRKDEVLCSGTLEECVAYSNRITGFDDTVDKE